MQKLKAAGIRAARTAVQCASSAALVAIGTAKTMGGVNWQTVVSTALLAAIVSLLMSVRGLPEVQDMDQNEEGGEEREEND